jgi:hypothetical protein
MLCVKDGDNFPNKPLRPKEKPKPEPTPDLWFTYQPNPALEQNQRTGQLRTKPHFEAQPEPEKPLPTPFTLKQYLADREQLCKKQKEDTQPEDTLMQKICKLVEKNLPPGTTLSPLLHPWKKWKEDI